MNLIIKKVLNSSVVLCTSDDGQEQIVLGKGIGYGKKAGTVVNPKDVNQIFLPVTKPELHQLESMLNEITPEVAEVTRKIVKLAEGKIPTKLHKSLAFSLMDHINFSLDRYKEGITFKNKLYWEVKSYYPVEFKIGQRALQMVNTDLNVDLPIEEAASLAFHVINSEYDNQEDSMEVTKIINGIMTIINMNHNTNLNQNTMNYQRLLTHVKFFAERVLRGQQLDSDDDEMYDHVISSYPDAVKIAIQIMDFLNKTYYIKITNEEMTYLVIHIQRNLIRK